MPYSFHPVNEVDLVIIRYNGEVDVDETIAAMKELATDPELRRLDRRLHDLRIARVNLESSDMRRLGKSAGDVIDEHWTAEEGEARRSTTIVPSEATFGLMRMFDAFVDFQVHRRNLLERDAASVYRVVRTFDEAADWLGLPVSYQDPFTPGDEGERDQT